MRRAHIFANGVLAGELEQTDDYGYVFRYDSDYLETPEYSSISLTLPKRAEPYESEVLFPFFFNMLSEGVNKTMQCSLLNIDERDYFSLLLKTAQVDTIGAITVKEVK